jgi:hypothetical protein
MNTKEMIDFATEHSFGACHIEWPEEFFDLAEEERQTLIDEFWRVSGMDQCCNCSEILPQEELDGEYCETCWSDIEEQ